MKTLQVEIAGPHPQMCDSTQGPHQLSARPVTRIQRGSEKKSKLLKEMPLAPTPSLSCLWNSASMNLSLSALASQSVSS